MFFNVIRSIVGVFIVFLFIGCSGNNNNDIDKQEKSFKIFGMQFGTKLVKIQSDKRFKCEELSDMVLCKTSIRDLNLSNIEYVDDIYFYFDENKFMGIKIFTNAFKEIRSERENRAKKVISYLEDIFNVKNYSNINSNIDIENGQYAMMNKMGTIGYSAANRAGLSPFYIKMRIFDKVLFKHYSIKKEKLKKEKRDKVKEDLNVLGG